MNHERILKVADVIEANPDHFDMLTFYGYNGNHLYSTPHIASRLALTIDLTECGTTACIAGWAVALWGAEVDLDLSIDKNADAILGLTYDQSFSVYYGMEHSTSDKAAAYLREMVREDLA